ncbi:MAG: hypothetical protein CMN21_24950 [Rubinisphaera sp.]|uniref:hypothetical protein n=1 Tax=Rubinisphaera sp. TaxID=2024857 RepID=UPI000C105A47|nr:hypothetical protein [Rubinisphaera sp.]MBV12454.1 hypothetical protein [Rubinisphaera sp.]
MPKITPSVVPNEGDIITKDSIKSTTTAVENIDAKIDEENIREEGLDWRNFKDGVCVDTDSSRSGMVFSNKDLVLTRSANWKFPDYPSGAVSGGVASNRAQFDFDWDPQTDTSIIIRCSLFVNSRHTASKNSKPLERFDAWDFGLLVIPPVAPGDLFTVPSEALRTVGTMSDTGPSVWPYQRMYLQTAFTDARRHGSASFKEYVIFKALGETKLNTMQNKGLFANFGEEFYSRGQWDQYGYDRSSNMNQSFTMVTHANSDRSAYLTGSNPARLFAHAGPGRVYLVYRCNANIDPTGLLAAGTVEIERFTLSAQIIRR